MLENPNQDTKKIKLPGKFITQPISQPDKRQKKTDIALPNEENVLRNKIWVDNNSK